MKKVLSFILIAAIFSLFSQSFYADREISDEAFIFGDLNGDNNVNSIDFAFFQKFILGKTTDFPSEKGKTAADLNGDGEINSIDFGYFRQFLLGMIKEFPINNKVYFVSPTGSDTNKGSVSEPFKTLEKAASIVKAGDICYIREGTYREVLKPLSTGTEDAPIVFKAIQGEKVVINACDLVTEWSLDSENIYVADIDMPVTQVFIDGLATNEARFPNSGNDLFSPETFEITKMDETEVIAEALEQEKNAFKGGTIWAMLKERWISQVGTIVASEEGRLTIEGNTWIDNAGSGVGYITGVKCALDANGEWYYEDGKIYIYLEEHPDNCDIQVKTRKWVFDLSSKDHIIIKDINTFGGAGNLNAANYCLLDNLSMEYLSHFTKIVSGGSSWLRHDWTNIDYDGIGIGIFGAYNTVKNSKINWSAGDGITMYGSNNRVENCIVSNCNYSGSDCNPITAHGEGHVITQNTVYNGGRGLIALNFAKKATVTYNHCYNAGKVNWDIGGIYVWGTEAEGTEIAYNWVHDIYSDGIYKIGNGIYIDNFCKDILVHHNVVWNCSYNAFNYSRPNSNIHYFNNTAFNALDVYQSYIPSDAEDTSEGNKMYNNLFDFAVEDFPALEKRNNYITEDIPLADIEDFDFRPLEEAIDVIDCGMDIPGVTDEFIGDAPDIGAYEKDGILWKAGAQ